jgi:hypothetical protein
MASTDDNGAVYHRLNVRLHLARWIKFVLAEGYCVGEPLAIVDPDTIWWKSVEDFEFGEGTLWAGFYQPYAWYEWTHTLAAPRLHTHFLWVPDVERLLSKAEQYAPYNKAEPVGYRDCHLFEPQMVWMNGHSIFFDVCAQFYNAAGGTPFEEPHLQCYDHINSASFRQYVKFERQEGFELVHELARTNPTALCGLYKEMVVYWRQMHQRAIQFAKMPRMHNMFPLPAYDPHATGAY